MKEMQAFPLLLIGSIEMSLSVYYAPPYAGIGYYLMMCGLGGIVFAFGLALYYIEQNWHGEHEATENNTFNVGNTKVVKLLDECNAKLVEKAKKDDRN